ncbi:MAG: precorrin-6B methylase 2, partial [Ulvibacter sp.]
MSLKNSLNYILTRFSGYKLVNKSLDVHLQLLLDEKYGHRLSRESGQAVDEKNNPIPWMTYPAIEYIEQFDLRDKTIFEWGSGNSSLYFSKRCKQITSIETKKDWFDIMQQRRNENMNIIFKDSSLASKSINDFDTKFDLIFIDSSTNRFECAKEASAKLNSGGLIILDNSDRYLKAAQHLKSQGYLQVDMHGIGPIVKFTTTTSFFFDRTFDWKILGDRQP